MRYLTLFDPLSSINEPAPMYSSWNSCASLTSNDTFYDDTSSVEMDTDIKRKSRNMSEKKRRDQFNVLLNELCSMVQCEAYIDDDYSHSNGGSGSVSHHHHHHHSSRSSSSSKHSSAAAMRKMDKSSILRSAIDYLKLYYESKRISDSSEAEKQMEEETELDDCWKPAFLSYEEFGYLMLDALDAFILIVDADGTGTITYASESILSLMGYNHNQFFDPAIKSASTSSERETERQLATTVDDDASSHETSSSIYDLIHDSDKIAFRSMLNHHTKESSYFATDVHMKRQRSYPVSFEVIRLHGSLSSPISPAPASEVSGEDSKLRNKSIFVMIGRLRTPKILKELRLVPSIEMHHLNKEFASRHSLEWKFLFLDHRASSLIGYMPFEVLGTSGYDYYHWDDLGIVVAGHEQLLLRGEGTSQQYRFLTKGQQWIWLKTKSYITYHQWNSKPEFIVCTHTVTGLDHASEEQQRRRIGQATTTTTAVVHPHVIFPEVSKYSIHIPEPMDIPAPASSSSGGSSSHFSSDQDSRRLRSKRKLTHEDSRLDFVENMIDSTQYHNPSSGYGGSRHSSDFYSDNCSDHKYERVNLMLPSESMDNMCVEPYYFCDPSLSLNVNSGPPSSSHNFPSLHHLHHRHLQPPQHHHHHHHLQHQVGLIDQSQAQMILKKKHDLLQAHIQKQQEELRRMEEQMFTAQYQMNQNNNSSNSRMHHHHQKEGSCGNTVHPDNGTLAVVTASSSRAVAASPAPDSVRNFIHLTACSNKESDASIEMDQLDEDRHQIHDHSYHPIEGQTMPCEASSEQMCAPVFTWNTGAA